MTLRRRPGALEERQVLPVLGVMSRQAKIYVGTEALYGVAMGMYGFVLNFFLLSLGLQTSQIGLITSAGIVVMGACALPLGFLAGRTGRKNMYAGGVLMIGANIVLYVLCPQALLFVPVVCLAAGMTMVEVSEVQVMYQSCGSDRERVTVFSVSFATFSLCSAVGTFLAGQLPLLLGYRGTMLAAGCITLAVGALRWRMLANDKAHNKISPQREKLRAPLRTVLDGRFFSFLAVIAFHGALTNTVGPFANLILKYRCGWQDGGISAVLTLASVCSFLFALYTPRLQRRRLYHTGMYVAAYVALIAVYVIMAMCGSTVVFVALFLVRSGLEILLKNMIDSVTYLTLEERQKDIYAGARSLTKGVVGAITAFLVGVLLERGQTGLVFWTAAALMVCAAVLFILFIAPIFGNKTNKEQTL